MSGLMTSFLLESVGVTNYTIIEGGQRFGGRVHTEYLNNSRPEDYQYQEMGPMRFPRLIKYADTNETLIIKVSIFRGNTSRSFHLFSTTLTKTLLSLLFPLSGSSPRFSTSKGVERVQCS